MKQHATSALKILHHLKNLHQLKNKRRRVVDEGQKDVSVDEGQKDASVDEGQRQSSQKDSEIDYTYEPSQPDDSEEFSYEEEANVDYDYHYDNDLGEYVALSSPSLAASMEKEFHPDCETQIESDSVDTAKSAGKSSKNHKKPFERVWSEDDEIFILEALLKYAENKRINPVSTTTDMTDFFNIFNRSFHRKVKRPQLAGKVGKLKKKFNNNIAREGEKKENKDTLFLKPHEAKLFHLSKKIWGSIGNDVNEALHAANNMVGHSHHLHFDGLNHLVREHGLNMSELEEKEKAALEEMWKDYKLSECVTFGKKAALDKKLVQQALNAHR